MKINENFTYDSHICYLNMMKINEKFTFDSHICYLNMMKINEKSTYDSHICYLNMMKINEKFTYDSHICYLNMMKINEKFTNDSHICYLNMMKINLKFTYDSHICYHKTPSHTCKRKHPFGLHICHSGRMVQWHTNLMNEKYWRNSVSLLAMNMLCWNYFSVLYGCYHGNIARGMEWL